MFKRCTALAFGLFMSTPVVLAQEVTVVGNLNGEIGGEAMSWQTLSLEGHGSTASFDEVIPGLISITIQGHIGGTFAMEKALSVQLTQNAQGQALESSVTYLPSGSIRDFYESAPGAVTVTITRLEETEVGAVVEGTATGKVRRVRINGIEVSEDASDTLDIDVTFTTPLVAIDK